MQVNSSTWYPITTQASPGLMPITDSELTVSSHGTKPGKEDPSHHAGKALGREWVTLPSPQSCMPYHIDWIAGEHLIEQQKAPPTHSSGGSSQSVHTWWWSLAHTRYAQIGCSLHYFAYMPAMESFKGLQWCKPQWLSLKGWIWHPAWHLKVQSRQQNRHQTYNI